MRDFNERRAHAASPEDLIHQLRQKGVTLWMQEARLRYRAPKGLLTAEEMHALVRAQEQIASVLQGGSCCDNRDSSVNPNSAVRRAPLSFTQLEYWNRRLRHGGRPIRHLACAFRLQGLLQLDSLKESVAAVGRRHDALRTRIVTQGDNLPCQEIADSYRSDLEVIDLRAIREMRVHAEVELQSQRAILDGQDFAKSPLFKAVLLAINPSEHVLILALDHVISDLTSLRLVSEEVFTVYDRLREGRPIDLPPVLTQFPDYAATLRAQTHESLARPARRFGSFPRTRFPEGSAERIPSTRDGVGIVPFAFDLDLMTELRAWARRHGTTVTIATFTAYAALILRWCAVKETVILFTTDGRMSAEMERTVGYLAFDLYIRVAIEQHSSFLDLLELVVEEYCRARDEADFGYAFAQEAPPEFTRNSGVNWLSAGGDFNAVSTPGVAVSVSKSPLEYSGVSLQLVAEHDREPDIGLSEWAGGIAGTVSFARSKLSDQTMTRFAANIARFLTAMLRAPARRVMDMEVQ